MTPEYAALGILEEKHAMATLFYLLDKGPCTKTDLYRGVSANPRMPDKLDGLESIGLIKQESLGRSTLISLTAKGEAVGTKLREALGIAAA